VLVALAGVDHSAAFVHDSEAPDSSGLGTGLSQADCQDLFDLHGDELRLRFFVVTDSCGSGTFVQSRLGPHCPVLLVAMLRSGTMTGVLAVSGRNVERIDNVEAVCAMAGQMALALESAYLTEQVLQRRNEAHFRSIIQNTSDMILVVNPELGIVYQTPSVQAVLGHDPAQVMGQPVLTLVSEHDGPRASAFLHRAQSAPAGSQHGPVALDDLWQLVDVSGSVRAFEVTCSNLLDDPSVRGLVLTLHDTTERRALEEELKHLAFHDSLTQLPNRILFLDRVEQALSSQGRHRGRLAVMLIDLDDFKMVNDTRGHAAGDALLVAVSERLQRVVRPTDTCARLGGDEFAVLLEGLVGDAEAGRLADRIQAVLRRPFGVGDDELTVRASVGVSTSEHGSHAAELLIQADLAMYAAKDAGKGSYEFYQPSLQHVMQTRLSEARDLRRALEEGQFALLYQPILELGTGRVVGTEALVRWQHPTKGLVLPGEFIDAVEQGDLAVPLGRWVIETAIAQAAQWQSLTPAHPPLRMSVNVAPRQLGDPAFVGIVTGALHQHGLRPNLLTLEITERTLTAREPQIEWAMGGLKRLGVGLAIDDFGTGYAALGYLRRFPVTTLKIDRSFVTDVDKSKDQRSLVKTIIRLGEAFGLAVVAEGIETSSQRDALAALGCDLGQGFLYAHALPADEATAYITDQPALQGDHAYLALTPYTDGIPIT
jgi:diguanylate cyclase (GGDEF)-like protein/PAS domain S-box-containing protein